MFQMLVSILDKKRCFQSSFVFSYVTTLAENAVEGTPLVFEGGLDQVQDLDKVSK